MKVCLGGTFFPLHNGHKALLKKAYEVAGINGSVYIGVTSDDLAGKKSGIASFEQRIKLLEQFLVDAGFTGQQTIQPLFDTFGPTVEGEFDAIIVSPETKPTAEEINRKRKKQGKRPLQIILVPFVLAEDNKPISSTRIRRKEIDEHGRLCRKE
jgi:pantetheine-phosphate adenylyltransferase